MLYTFRFSHFTNIFVYFAISVQLALDYYTCEMVTRLKSVLGVTNDFSPPRGLTGFLTLHVGVTRLQSTNLSPPGGLNQFSYTTCQCYQIKISQFVSPEWLNRCSHTTYFYYQTAVGQLSFQWFNQFSPIMLRIHSSTNGATQYHIASVRQCRQYKTTRSTP